MRGRARAGLREGGEGRAVVFAVWFTRRSELACLGVGAGGERASDASRQHDRNPAAPCTASPRAAGGGGRPCLVQFVHPHPAQEALQDEADEECAGAEPGGQQVSGFSFLQQGIPAAPLH